MGTGRFDRLERERSQPGAPAARPSVEARFGGGADQADTEAGPARSGGEAARFEEPESPERIRVLDTDAGQAFVRCVGCRADNFVNATHCGECGADLLTPAQRAFNEALWRKLCADKAEEDREVEALRERRAVAEREQAEAMRLRQQIELDLERRRERGLPLDDADDVSDPLRSVARGLGRFVGQTLRRLLPNRTLRLAACVLALVSAVALVVTFPRLLFGGLWVFFILAGLAARLVRRSRRF